MVMSGPVGCRNIIASIDKEREKVLTGKVWHIKGNEYFAKHIFKVSQDAYANDCEAASGVRPPLPHNDDANASKGVIGVSMYVGEGRVGADVSDFSPGRFPGD
jgi:hypothetical protein